MTIDDLKVKGAKLPKLTKCKYRVIGWTDDEPTRIDGLIGTRVSFETRILNNIEYILVDYADYTGRNYFMVTVSEIEKFAIKQGMIKKTKTLPKSFACKNTNQELWDKYIGWLNSTYPAYFSGDSKYYYGIDKRGKANLCCIKSFDTILSLEEWDEIVNNNTKTEEVMKTTNYYISRAQLKNIYNVACNDWKERIEEFAKRNPFGDMIEFNQSEINAMFKAATASQVSVLEGIFGAQTKELSFVSKKINFKVDDISVFGNSTENTTIQAFIGLPPLYASSKNVFYLNPNYNWEIDGNNLTVTRK